jgi:tetratricopeptide (TPR) repeat protein
MRFCVLGPVLLLSCFAVFLSTDKAIAEQTWTEVRSPHFRVVTDGSSKDARNVAYEFEQMHHVFETRFQSTDIDSGAPLTIVAARDESTYRSVAPTIWKSQGNKLAGVFFRGWEKQFALIRLDTWGDANEVVVYHEYTHSVLHANAHWLPIWLDEGMAEFYAYTRFKSDRIYVGAPSMRLGELRNRTLIPVLTMLDIDSRSPYYQHEVQLFYAEAWAMVHYMTFGPGMGNGEKLNQFFKIIQDGTSQQKAFQQIFGDPRAFDNSFLEYVIRLGFSAAVLPPDHSSDPKTFSERKLTPAEATYEVGCFQVGTHDRTNARTSIEKSIATDPRLAAAHEELAYLNFDEGKDDEARKEWNQAITLDPSLPRSQFALTMTGLLAGKLSDKSTDQLHTAQLALQHITQLGPNYAPAYVELALVEWQLGSVREAYKDAHHAEILEPWRASYHLLTGHILLRGQQPALAASYSRYVATHYVASDHDEAVDLWKAIPANMQGDGPPLALDIPPGADVARGRLLDVSCSGSPGASKLTITLMPDNAADAKPLTFTTDGRFAIGFSDTLWWGEDHFSSCHHLSGQPAVLVYKSQGAKGPEVVELEIRDDLPDNM